MTDEQRSDISNGLWLCSVCHTMIDADETKYPVELLQEWKEKAETQAGTELGERITTAVAGMQLSYIRYKPATLPESIEDLRDLDGLPPGSRVPFTRNAVFTGREDRLLELARALLYGADDKKAVGIVGTAKVAAATGMGGIGKTQLAVEFCWRYGRYFAGVHWLAANQDLEAEISACGIEMRLEPWSDKQEEQVRATLAAWQEHGSRLVVLDNVEDLQLLRDWQSKLRAVKLLLTSRIGRWPPGLGVHVQRLGAMKRKESQDLLAKLAPHLRQVDVTELDKIADRYRDVPLGLHLAGSYMASHSETSVDEYLIELEKRGGVLKEERLPDWVADDPTNYGRNLWAAFEIELETLRDDDRLGQAARRTFLSSGYCAVNSRIPRNLLVATTEMEVRPGKRRIRHYIKHLFRQIQNQIALSRKGRIDPDLAIEKLVQVGLLEFGDAGLVAHPLLAEFARALDDQEDNGGLLRLAFWLVWLADQAIQTGIPADFFPLRPHVEATAEWAEKAGLPEGGALWNSLGSHLRMVAEYQTARTALERALVIWETSLRKDHPLVATGVNNLGGILWDLGDFKGARALFERALKIDEKAFGHKHPNVAIRVNNLGLVLQNQGDLAGAKMHFERALKIGEEKLGKEHPDVATWLNNLGQVLQDLRDLDGARAAYSKALEIWEKHLGSNHPQVSIGTNNLGLVLRELGDLAGARAQFERALRIDEDALGPEHPNVATDVNNLGLILRDIGDLAGARAQFERALRIDEVAFGSEHPNIAHRIFCIGMIDQERKDLNTAQEEYQRALDIYQMFLPSDHQMIVMVKGYLDSVQDELKV